MTSDDFGDEQMEEDSIMKGIREIYSTEPCRDSGPDSGSGGETMQETFESP